MTHVSMRSEFCPSCSDSKEAHHISKDPSFEVKDLFGRSKSLQTICTKGTYFTGQGRLFCVDFYTCGR